MNAKTLLKSGLMFLYCRNLITTSVVRALFRLCRLESA